MYDGDVWGFVPLSTCLTYADPGAAERGGAAAGSTHLRLTGRGAGGAGAGGRGPGDPEAAALQPPQHSPAWHSCTVPCTACLPDRHQPGRCPGVWEKGAEKGGKEWGSLGRAGWVRGSAAFELFGLVGLKWVGLRRGHGHGGLGLEGWQLKDMRTIMGGVCQRGSDLKGRSLYKGVGLAKQRLPKGCILSQRGWLSEGWGPSKRWGTQGVRLIKEMGPFRRV